MIHYLGVDPGQRGGLVLIDEDGDILLKSVMPKTKENTISFQGLEELATEIGLISKEEIATGQFLVVMEAVHAMPNQGVVSMFTFGKNYGALFGLFAAKRWPIHSVSPNTWMRVIHKIYPDIPCLNDTKMRSLFVANKLKGESTFLAGPRSRKPDLGLIEAYLIAEYGRRIKLKQPLAVPGVKVGLT